MCVHNTHNMYGGGGEGYKANNADGMHYQEQQQQRKSGHFNPYHQFQPIPKVNVITATPPAPPSCSTPPGASTSMTTSPLPPFQPIPRSPSSLDHHKASTELLPPPGLSSMKKISRSASVVSLVPAGGFNTRGDPFMKIVTEGERKRNVRACGSRFLVLPRIFSVCL